MSNGSILPPDIQEQLAKKPRSALPGIGSAAPENASRRTAPEPEPSPAPPVAKAEDDTTCKSTFCNAAVPLDAAFCSKCGFDQMRGGLIKKLGIDPFTDEDIQDYIFRGYVVRDIKVVGKHTVTMRSSQAKDLKEIDTYIMTGSWSKSEDGKERQISEFFLRQMNALCATAMSIQKMDGQSIGATLVERMAWLEERGSAFVDLLAQKTSLFNQALTDHLKKEDTLSGS
jgi:ribosomal protein L40E